MSAVINASRSHIMPPVTESQNVFNPTSPAVLRKPRGTTEERIHNAASSLGKLRDSTLYSAKQTYTSPGGKVLGMACRLSPKIAAVGNNDKIDMIVGPGAGAGFLLESRKVIDSKTGRAVSVESLPHAQQEMLANTLAYAEKTVSKFRLTSNLAKLNAA
jgi:hypothetical protein